MSRADIEQEKAALLDKFFNCTETPIKEWIADFLKEPVKTLFTDYVDESDVIGFMHEGKHYSAYVVTLPHDSPCMVPIELLKTCEKASKACSMLYDAMRQVFMAVTGSAAQHMTDLDRIEFMRSIMPVFMEEKMAFCMKRVNRKAMQAMAAHKQRGELTKHLRESSDEQERQRCVEAIEAVEKIIRETTKEDLDAYEVMCGETNKLLAMHDNMHICLEASDPSDMENLAESMKRLPVFGLQFQDPEEENYIDKLKKEQNVRE